MGLALTGLLATPGGERRAPAAIQTARTAQHGACEALVVVMGGEAWGIVFAPRRKRLPPWRKLRWVGLNKVRRRCCHGASPPMRGTQRHRHAVRTLNTTLTLPLGGLGWGGGWHLHRHFSLPFSRQGICAVREPFSVPHCVPQLQLPGCGHQGRRRLYRRTSRGYHEVYGGATSQCSVHRHSELYSDTSVRWRRQPQACERLCNCKTESRIREKFPTLKFPPLQLLH